ncbi:hypothetical protein MKEN_00904100 [Mycena kentingensis (nom. inval.)]|nr:hypothetical protein MKEN_00904100 [Mycena kentingensis (nom. inval.)]
MFIPFFTHRRSKNTNSKQLAKRRGGGRSGGGGGAVGGAGGGGGARSASSVSTGGTSKSASSYGTGGGRATTIPSGQLFAGRSEGGGTRGQVFGTRVYGSGYPSDVGRGVAGRGFPFYFWPIGFGGLGGAAYYHSNSEYGRSNNSSRPGGPIVTAAFQSLDTKTTLRILADNTTVVALITDISANCSDLTTGVPTPASWDDEGTAPPQPEQMVQYYRASSIALSLDGYNNTAIFEAEGTPDVALPSGIDAVLLDCVNQTIGAAAPLIDAGSTLPAPSMLGIVSLIWISSFFM